MNGSLLFKIATLSKPVFFLSARIVMVKKSVERLIVTGSNGGGLVHLVVAS